MKDEVRNNHPAFGTISASRISGHRNLFASDVDTGGYVCIRIQRAEYEDGVYYDNVYSHAFPLMEIALSEAQWVAFISRMNTGTGSPCTLTHRPDDDARYIRPEMPEVEKSLERMGRRVREIRAKEEDSIKARIEELTSIITGKLPKKEHERVTNLLKILAGHLMSNLEFGAEMLTEHKEKMVAAAKVEINAFIQSRIQALGIEKLREALEGTVLPALDQPLRQPVKEDFDQLAAYRAKFEALGWTFGIHLDQNFIANGSITKTSPGGNTSRSFEAENEPLVSLLEHLEFVLASAQHP